MKTFLVSKIFPDSLSDALAPLGKVIRLDDSVCFGAPLSHHPDALVGRMGDTLFVSAAETKIVNVLEKHGVKFRTSACVPENEYPRDCPMNFFTVREFFVAKEKSVCPEALEYALLCGYKPVFVSQGYAKCSTVIAGGGIISADTGICEALAKRGVDVLQIPAGHVELPPYEYGFIGGACGNISENEIIFFGDIETHPSHRQIRDFCEKHGVKIVSGSGNLFDFGGFVCADT